MSRRFYKAAGPVKKTRLNHEIRLSPIRLINERNEQVGVVETSEARRMAEEAGLDLVEIQPDVRPPLCKIMDYGKFKYEESKKKKGGSSKGQELKEVRLGRSAKIDEHDVEIRVNQARKFLMQGHKVMFVQRFRGREMAFQDIGLDRLKEIAEGLGDIAKVESPPKQQGRQMSMLLTPDKPKVEAIKRKLEAEKAAEDAKKKEQAGEDAEAQADTGNEGDAESSSQTTNAATA